MTTSSINSKDKEAEVANEKKEEIRVLTRGEEEESVVSAAACVSGAA